MPEESEAGLGPYQVEIDVLNVEDNKAEGAASVPVMCFPQPSRRQGVNNTAVCGTSAVGDAMQLSVARNDGHRESSVGPIECMNDGKIAGEVNFENGSAAQSVAALQVSSEVCRAI
jgi:hypothetical protein